MKHSKIVFMLATLMFSSAKAQDEKVNFQKIKSVYVEIRNQAEMQPAVLNYLVTLKKNDLEETLATDFTDEEYGKVFELMDILIREGVNVDIKKIDDIILATQEYHSGI